MITSSELLTAARGAGLTLYWQAGKLKAEGPPDAILIAKQLARRKGEFTACPGCAAVTPSAQDYCDNCGLPREPVRPTRPPLRLIPPPPAEPAEQHDPEPDPGDLMRTECGSCFRAQLRPFGATTECVAEGCGNRTRWNTPCPCGQWAVPGTTRCLTCKDTP